MSSACFKNYYRVKSTSKPTQRQWRELSHADRMIIVHFKDYTQQLVNVMIQDSSIYGQLIPPPAMETKYLEPKKQSKNPYKFKERDLLFSQIHLYVNEPAEDKTFVTINKNNFYKMALYEPNKGASIGSHVLGSALLMLTVSAIALPVLASEPVTLAPAPTDCNCPQVYLENNPGMYTFQAGMYSGAIVKPLERMDILPLQSFTPFADSIRLRILNLPGETQFINQAYLRKLTHAIHTTIATSNENKIFATATPILPASVSAEGKKISPDVLKNEDDFSYAFNLADSNSTHSELVLEFDVPQTSDKALILLKGSNTQWSGLLFTYLKLINGKQYAQWATQKEGGQDSGINQWMAQLGLLMKIEVWNGERWKPSGKVPMLGNTAKRTIAAEVDLKGIKPGKMKVKLISAFHLWELDHVSVSTNYQEIKETELLPLRSATLNVQDTSQSLSKADGHYSIMQNNDELILVFPGESKKQNNMETTYLLYMQGYYHQSPLNNQTIQIAHPLNLARPGSLHQWSMKLYRDLGFYP
jgi:hypothetical protein